ncbi:uncharacterized protein LOC125026690 isoform X1 [Penaeus chinensis]|uniref:uncharacterized protein LOC125026690 isoform X1 n=1 Tax=Penaeus chinensis TaxID=139456 RepID=UPI001FB620BA|nr:uncharacterized protein LOC125026690 isoform X1 [Penaeus chinensis]
MKVARRYRDLRDLVALSGCASLCVMMEQTASLTFSPTASLCLATGPVAQTIHPAEAFIKRGSRRLAYQRQIASVQMAFESKELMNLTHSPHWARIHVMPTVIQVYLLYLHIDGSTSS